MSETALAMLPGLLALPPEDREMLAKELLSSLDEQDDQFAATLNLRITEMQNDPSKRVPADAVLKKLQEKYP
jgi:hypothetical protein